MKQRPGKGRTAQGERSALLAADDAKAITADKAAALALTPVSRETEERLDRYLDLLREWQAKTNLVAPSTLPQLWTRHIVDSLQLLSLALSAKIWVDLGSGGGFPGIVLACALADVAGARVHLSKGKLTVTDGPFTESKEVIGGLAILQADSKQAAIEMVKQFLRAAGDGECELRELYEQPACAGGDTHK